MVAAVVRCADALCSADTRMLPWAKKEAITKLVASAGAGAGAAAAAATPIFYVFQGLACVLLLVFAADVATPDIQIVCQIQLQSN